MVMSFLVLAQSADMVEQAGQAVSAADVRNVWDFVVKGGIMMIPIGLGSLVALAVVVERSISLRRRKVIPEPFLPGLHKVLKAHPGDATRALAYCRKNPSPVANIFAAGIKKLGRPTEVVEKHIQEASDREVLSLRKFLRGLSVIASVSPLMGLLGTIFGMIAAFQTVALSADALGKTELLAGGIYEAMITTAAGLLVAIPALIFYHWICAKIDRLVMDIDGMTVSFLEEFVEGEPHVQEEVAPGGQAEARAVADVQAPPVRVATT